MTQHYYKPVPNRFCVLLAIALFLTGIVIHGPVNAEDSRYKKIPKSAIKTQIAFQANEKHTAFKPRIHGFAFPNSFNNNFTNEIRTAGLCGGMVYSALDYYNTSVATPRQSYRPANETTLQQYLYRRQTDSVMPNIDKWVDFGSNPGGSKNTRLFNTAFTDEFANIKASINRGIPVPLGVFPVEGGDVAKGHQVIAIGYKEFPATHTFSVFLYDPNHPNVTPEMKVNKRNKYFYYPHPNDTSREIRWRTFFVNKSYRVKRPPRMSEPNYPRDGKVRELVIHFRTGDDDLRGGDDNVNMILHLRGGKKVERKNINLGARWLSNYKESASVKLPYAIKREDIVGIEFVTTFGGGIGGDNWDVNSIQVMMYDGSERVPLAARHSFFRFTGDKRHLRLSTVVSSRGRTASAEGKITKLRLIIRTGRDDLRGNEDNLDATILYRNGRQRIFRTINERKNWEAYKQQTVFLTLDKPVNRNEIVGVVLRTTSRGGMSGDNWDMNKLTVSPFEEREKRGAYFYKEGSPIKRFTGTDNSYSARW